MGVAKGCGAKNEVRLVLFGGCNSYRINDGGLERRQKKWGLSAGIIKKGQVLPPDLTKQPEAISPLNLANWRFLN